MSRLCALPLTADVPGRGCGSLAAGPDSLTVTGSSGSWSVDLQPDERPQRPDHARWLRRGLAGTLIGLGAGVTALALNLPADGVPGTTRQPATPVADSSPDRRTEVVPPVVRTLSVGTRPALAGQGGTP